MQGMPQTQDPAFRDAGLSCIACGVRVARNETMNHTGPRFREEGIRTRQRINTLINPKPQSPWQFITHRYYGRFLVNLSYIIIHYSILAAHGLVRLEKKLTASQDLRRLP